MAGDCRGDRIKVMGAEQPDYCGKCGYDLTGLPSVGDCPECGQTYSSWSDAGGGRHGADRSARRPWIVRHARSLLLLVAALPVLCCAGLLSFVAGSSQYVLIAGSVLTFLLLLGAAISYVFERLE